MKIRTYYTSYFVRADHTTARKLQEAARLLGQKCDMLPRNDGLPILATYPMWGIGGLDFGYRFNTMEGVFEASKAECVPDTLISLVSLEDGCLDGYYDVIEHNQVSYETMVAAMQADSLSYKRYESALELCRQEVVRWYRVRGFENIEVIFPKDIDTSQYRLPAYCGKCDIAACFQDIHSFYIFCILKVNESYIFVVAEPMPDSKRLRQFYSQGGWHKSLYECVEYMRGYLYGLTKRAKSNGFHFTPRFWNCYGAAIKFENVSDGNLKRIAYTAVDSYKIGDRVTVNSHKWYDELKDQFGIVEYSDKDGDFSQLMSEYCGCTMTITERMCENQYKLNNMEFWFPDWCFTKASKEDFTPRYTPRNAKSKKTYLMRDSNTGYTKIGMSVNPRQRECTLQSEKPTITLFRVCDTLVEKELHSRYAVKRVRGEWFDLTEADIERICNDYQFKEI